MTQEEIIKKFSSKMEINQEMEKEKTVYVAMAADLLHEGHINILNEARKLGDVTIGLLTDQAIASYKPLPIMDFSKRKRIIENVVGVSQVIAQETHDYVPNLLKLKPDFVVHGDDWRTGIQKPIRDKVVETITQWGGQLIEVPYTKSISSTRIKEDALRIGTTPDIRIRRLRRLLNSKNIVRVLESHNGLSGLIAEHTKVFDKKGAPKEFDGIWISSLTDSTAKGKPDIELVDLTSRLETISDILDVTTKPIIVDGDSGGIPEHFVHTVRKLERIGVSAIIIEDKVGLKKNSLFGTDVNQTQDSIENFSDKIIRGKKSQVTGDFMIIARIESLILKKGVDDALKRAEAYIEAGADAIMIHSKDKDTEEIMEFCKEYKKFENKVFLIAVPSAYSHITEKELSKAGVNLVIYANHLLRSAYPAMVKTAETILKNERAHEVEDDCMPIKEILELIPGGK